MCSVHCALIVQSMLQMSSISQQSTFKTIAVITVALTSLFPQSHFKTISVITVALTSFSPQGHFKTIFVPTRHDGSNLLVPTRIVDLKCTLYSWWWSMLRPGQKMSLSFLVWTRPASLQSSVVDPDPHGSGTYAWIRIQIRNYCFLKNERFYFSFQACEFWTLCTVGLLYEIENGIYVVGRFLFLIELKVFF